MKDISGTKYLNKNINKKWWEKWHEGKKIPIQHKKKAATKEAVMDACNELLSLPTVKKAEYLDDARMDPIYRDR